jgi:hypothetical protein
MRTSRTLLAVAGATVLLLGAAACGSSSPKADGNTPQAYGGSQNGNQAQGRTGPPGADGKVAAVDGSTAQVQNQMTGQVAVSWTSATTFTKQVSTTKAAVTTGTCVMVEPAQGSAGDSATAVTAASVRILPKTNGSCTPALRGGGPQVQQNGGGPPAGGSAEGPGSSPGSGPAGGGRPGRNQLRGFGAFGEVTGVTASGFTVSATMPTGGTGSGTGSGTRTSTVRVTTSPSTTYTTTAKAAASDVKVGVCLRAEGTADSTGAISARTIAVTPPVNGQCGGMVFRRDGGPGQGSVSGSSADTTQVS